MKTSEKENTTELRKEPRYPCLGIGLLYSLHLDANMENIAADIFRAQLFDMSVHGLSIDVNNEYIVGEILNLCIEAGHEQRENLAAEVKWCKQVSEDSFRLGLTILSYGGASKSCLRSFTEGCYDQQKHAVPSEIRLFCPACEQRVVFEYQGEQTGVMGEKNKLSLYNCPACGTTRSIATILQYNRQR